MHKDIEIFPFIEYLRDFIHTTQKNHHISISYNSTYIYTIEHKKNGKKKFLLSRIIYTFAHRTIKHHITMKKIASIFIVLFACLSLHAEEQAITFGELPKNAKIFVLTYFKNIPFKEVYIERRASLTQYEVKLKGGIDLQFDRTGLCTEVSCENGAVPDEIIPQKILLTTKKHFPKNYIRKFENNGRMYDLELDNGTVLTFSRTLRLVDIDE